MYVDGNLSISISEKIDPWVECDMSANPFIFGGINVLGKITSIKQILIPSPNGCHRNSVYYFCPFELQKYQKKINNL